MAHFLIRVSLEETRRDPRRHGNAKPVSEILEDFECEVESKRGAKDLMDSIADYLENEHGFDFSSDRAFDSGEDEEEDAQE